VLVRDFLEKTAERLPDKIALVCGKQTFSYSALDASANRLATILAEHGVHCGDRVAIHLPNSFAAVTAIFAALKAGAVFVPINPTVKPEKLAFILNDCRASVLFSELKDNALPGSDWLRFVVDCDRQNHPGRGQSNKPAYSQGTATGKAPTVLDLGEVLAAPVAARPQSRNSDQDLACLIYTSGSTGQSKAVMSEHRNVVFVSGSIIQYLENTESDIVFNALPLSFDYGLYQLLMTFRFGGKLVLEQSFAFPALALKRIEQERVTGLPGVPTFFSLLLQQDLSAFDLASLRYLTNTAAALPPSHVLELQRKFPRARLYSMYGLTETKRTLYLPPAELERRPASVGIPIPGTEAWIESDSGERMQPGEIGELVVRGQHVMRGYWERPDATARRFRPGSIPGERLCYTGDLFRQDAEGFFYFVARKDDIIKSRGEKVAPKEVENVLYSLPGILEAAVVGIPHRILGQAIKAFVVSSKKELTPTGVLAHCRAHLEDFMVPLEVEFRDFLPKNASGKIDKLALSQRPTADCTTETQKEGFHLRTSRNAVIEPLASSLSSIVMAPAICPRDTIGGRAGSADSPSRDGGGHDTTGAPIRSHPKNPM